MNWAAVAALTAVIVAVCGGFAAYLNARFDAAINKLALQIAADTRELADELERERNQLAKDVNANTVGRHEWAELNRWRDGITMQLAEIRSEFRRLKD